MNDLISQSSAVGKPLSAQSTGRLRSIVIGITTHPLALLLLTFFCTALLWAFIIEPGRAPDEWDHFDYIRHLAIRHTLPIYGQTLRIRNPDALNSEAQQPPLYYLLATPFYLLGGPTP